MIAWFSDAFGSELTQRALLAGLLVAVTTSLIGTWVVVRGLSFMGDALAHGVLPGIALAFLWGLDVTLGALVSAALMVGGINLVNRRAHLSEDTGIGLLFVGMLALGVVIISREDTYAGDLTAFLFGDILGVRPPQLRMQAVVAGLTLLAVAVLYRPFLALSFNREKAAALGQRPALAHAAMLALLALAIVASFRVVGTLLVFGLLVAPPATATLVVRRLPAAMAASVALGCLAVVVGLATSYHQDTAAAATVAGVAVAQFFVALAVRETVAFLRSRRPAVDPGPPAPGAAPAGSTSAPASTG
ncbi:MAG TPA: zinc ABC transporter permease AztB [Acidimicrobiales bacterium]|nr:zinc ABC transporter permease AztB [Acidimicrobiales bacterium]